jgi:hypothetical protein
VATSSPSEIQIHQNRHQSPSNPAITPNRISTPSETYIPWIDVPENCRSSAIRVRSRSLRRRNATTDDTPWNMTNAKTPRTWRNFHQLYASKMFISR